MEEVHISLKAERLFEFLGIPITNSIFTTWMVMSILILGSFIVTRNITLVPGSPQLIGEILIGGLYQLFQAVTGEKIRKFFPLLASLFLFVIASNWVGLLPGVGTIGLNVIEAGHLAWIPIFRAGTADLNTTLALAIVAVVTIQYYGIKTLGNEYVARFFNFKNPIYFFVGILELMSEGTKVISFAFRLFGNIFAGEVLLTVVAFLMPVLAPLPFLALELFVGFIQALVFSMLTAVFLTLATSHQEH